jgi:hypothetical protein
LASSVDSDALRVPISGAGDTDNRVNFWPRTGDRIVSGE